MATLTTLMVPGMTCGHCVSSVTKELEAVPGVANVIVELRKGEESEVTVFSDSALSEDALREAIDEAGYDIASISSDAQALENQAAVEGAATLAGEDLGLTAVDAAPQSGCGCGNCNCK